MNSAVIRKLIFLKVLRGRALPICAVVILLYGVISRWVLDQNPDSTVHARFLLNLGLTLSVVLSRIVTLILASTHLAVDIEARTVYPLLARPISRQRFLLEVWGAMTLIGSGLLLLLSLLALLVTPSIPGTSVVTLLQHLLVQVPALAAITAIGMALSLVMAPGGALVVTGFLTFFGGMITTVSGPSALVPRFLPQLDLCNLATRFTAGMSAMPPLEYGALWFHALLWSLIGLTVSSVAFERRAL